MAKEKLSTPKPLKIVMRGDRRITENMILEVREAARKCGLEVASVQISPRPLIRPKVPKRGTRRNRANKT